MGALCTLEMGAAVNGCRPVRTMGGCSKVDIAAGTSVSHISTVVMRWTMMARPSLNSPLCPSSVSPAPPDVSRDPPTEGNDSMELAVEPRRDCGTGNGGPCEFLGPDQHRTYAKPPDERIVCAVPLSPSLIPHLGNVASRAEPGNVETLSIEGRGPGTDAMEVWLCRDGSYDFRSMG